MNRRAVLVRWAAVLGVAVVLMGTAVFLYARQPSGAAPDDGRRSSTLTVSRRDFVRAVRLSGTVEAVQSTTIAAPRLSGPSSNSLIITKLVRPGSTVSAGALIVEFDRQDQIKNALDRRAELQDLEQQIAKREAQERAARAHDDSELSLAESAIGRAQLEMVKNYLIDHKEQFRTFWKGDAAAKSLFKSGEIVISSGYPDTAKALSKEGVNAKFVTAEEGQFLWACGYGISPDIDPENLDAAYALLNWYTSPEAELYEAATWNYQVANQKVLDIAPQSVIDEASLEAPFHLENAIPASPPENRDAWVAAWTEVKAS